MRTFILESSNEKDLELLLIMASRLNIAYKEIETSSQANTINKIYDEEYNKIEKEENNFLLEGLGLDKSTIPITYEELENETLPSPYLPNLEKAIPFFGLLEDDKSETLEELLNLLD
ncbi:hypothetical protein Fleli_1137 [Bernardetia litoralis DSM 6794]|uniref:Uncharacterized protein n=1 Tax=Bernardetia litoralis (strain ATCC 23117 / DSM 6794 / NBRC 15988 / NCIMB 1366 / Fx l1 / Sio-4) TaxID=880071 RepID=I4AHZ0_BERLS|nr:hypothetical protein [Bernardetia litoralis]AFM03575.1 hypothetical protein Fleli_1137 [Bernardetia litoralis DSM 6794]